MYGLVCTDCIEIKKTALQTRSATGECKTVVNLTLEINTVLVNQRNQIMPRLT